jgi:hypothetical protein
MLTRQQPAAVNSTPNLYGECVFIPLSFTYTKGALLISDEFDDNFILSTSM